MTGPAPPTRCTGRECHAPGRPTDSGAVLASPPGRASPSLAAATRRSGHLDRSPSDHRPVPRPPGRPVDDAVATVGRRRGGPYRHGEPVSPPGRRPATDPADRRLLAGRRPTAGCSPSTPRSSARPGPCPWSGRWSAWPPHRRRRRLLAGGLRRRRLRLRRRRVLRLHGRQAAQPPGRRHGRHARRRGYWLVASDGGIFAFGDAAFHGSMGGEPLNRPVVGMAPLPTAGATGWWPPTAGSSRSATPPSTARPGAITLASPVVGMAVDPATGGYRLVAADGGVFCFDAPFAGSAVGLLRRAAVGIVTRTAPATGWSRPTAGSTPSAARRSSGRSTCPPLVGEVVTIDPGHDGGNGADPASSTGPSTAATSPNRATRPGPTTATATPSTPSTSTWPPGSAASFSPGGPPWSSPGPTTPGWARA